MDGMVGKLRSERREVREFLVLVNYEDLCLLCKAWETDYMHLTRQLGRVTKASALGV